VADDASTDAAVTTTPTVQQSRRAAAAAKARDTAAEALRQVVTAALHEGASPAADGDERYRRKVLRLLTSATPACGGVLEVLLALFTVRRRVSCVCGGACACAVVRCWLMR
jgi:hypothetical protein